jgi:hypothetical protein
MALGREARAVAARIAQREKSPQQEKRAR